MNLLRAGFGVEAIAELAAVRTVFDPTAGKQVPSPIDRAQVETVYRSWAKRCSKPEDIAELRALAVDRLRNDMARFRARGKLSAAELAALRGHEQLLSDLEGTRQPIDVNLGFDVNVRFRGATMRVVQDLIDTDRFDALAEEQLELERRASAIETHGRPAFHGDAE